MRIAMIGTRGVPAQYGGFETAVEEIGWRLAEQGHEIIVYSRNPKQRLTSYRGMKIVNLPAIRSKTLETLSHSALSTARAIIRDRTNVAFVFNSANAPYIPMLKVSGIPVIVHVDGLEASRPKWQGWGAKYYGWAEPSAVKSANAVIADAIGIQDHIKQQYQRDSVFIPYGAPLPRSTSETLVTHGITPGEYLLIVARFEPENHILEAIAAYQQSGTAKPLIIVGSAPYSNGYIAQINSAAARHPGIRLLGHVSDQVFLDELYANASAYIHGHSVGGTNPSLLRAATCSIPVFAFDSIFNREVLGELGMFWSSAEMLTSKLADGDSWQATKGEAIRARYSWNEVARQYAELAAQIATTPSRKIIDDQR